MIAFQLNGIVISKPDVPGHLLRVNWGDIEFFITGVNEMQAMHQFQSSHHYPAKSAKSFSDGFEIYFGCEVLPVGEKE
jgi:hypothetical protein